MKSSLILQLLVLLFILSLPVQGQRLKPGFDKQEFLEMIYLSGRQADTVAYYKNIPSPQRFRIVYRSPLMGLDNR